VNFGGPIVQCWRDPGSGHFIVIDPFVPPVAARQAPGVPYQIYRAPKRAAGRPLLLSGNSMIDLEFSGIGLDLNATMPTRAAGECAESHSRPRRRVRGPEC
jgi:hypothetical protein